MNYKEIDVSTIKSSEIDVGHQGEINVLTLNFSNIDFDGDVYIAYQFEKLKKVEIVKLEKQVTYYQLPIDTLLTKWCGKYTCLLFYYETDEDGYISKRELTDEFYLVVSHSLDVRKGILIEHVPVIIKNIYDSFNNLIKTITDKLNNHEFDGEDGYSPTVTIMEGTNEHTINITDKDGTKSTVVKDGLIPSFFML